MESRTDSRPSVCFQFQVEKILGVSADGNYQVQWAPAWVSKFHLVGCQHLIQEFLQEQAEMAEIDTELNNYGDINANSEMNCSRCHSPELAGQLPVGITMAKSEMQEECDEADSGNCTNHQIANGIPHQQLIVDAVKIEPEHLEDLTTISDTGNSLTDLEPSEDETICQTSVETSNSLLGGEEKSTALKTHLRFSVNQLPNSVSTSSMDSSFRSLYDEYHLPQVVSEDGLATDMEMQKQKQCSSPVDYPRKSSTTISVSKKRHSCTEYNKTFRQRCEESSWSPVNQLHKSQTTSSTNNDFLNIPGEHDLPLVVSEDEIPTHEQVPAQEPFFSQVDNPISSSLMLPRKRHVCSVCKKTCGSPSELIRHFRTHSGERPFKCTQCHKLFTEKHNLITHMRKHSGDKPFSCEICGKSFTQSYSLRRHHQHIHSNET